MGWFNHQPERLDWLANVFQPPWRYQGNIPSQHPKHTADLAHFFWLSMVVEMVPLKGGIGSI